MPLTLCLRPRHGAYSATPATLNYGVRVSYSEGARYMWSRQQKCLSLKSTQTLCLACKNMAEWQINIRSMVAELAFMQPA